jgi:hypothetical protein
MPSWRNGARADEVCRLGYLSEPRPTATADAPNDTETGNSGMPVGRNAVLPVIVSVTPPLAARGQILFLADLSIFEGTSKEDRRARNKI